MAVILSIKPIYVEEIRRGNKKYEFRKVNYQTGPESSQVFIYETKPTNLIVGYFEIRDHFIDSPQNLWNLFSKYSGIDKVSFFQYYKNSEKGVALKFKNTKFFAKPIDPFKEIRNFSPPQSFRYLKQEEFAVLLKYLHFTKLDDYF